MEAPTEVLSLGFGAMPWRFSSKGHYLLVKDPVRAIWHFYHPVVISQDGDFAALTARAVVPATWQGPVFLNLYANDPYVAEGWEEAGWTHFNASCHNFVGHRFKQVLIDSRVVWEQDVGDAEEFGYFNLDISPHVQPGRAFDLTLRVLDKVGSATPLPGDAYFLGPWNTAGHADPEMSKKFYIRVFWADVALSAGAAVAWEQNPARGEVPLQPVPQEAGPGDPEGSFLLDCPNGLPHDGYPVSWGVPFGQGRLFAKDRVVLTDPGGRRVPLQTEVLSHWPDGSIRWLLMDFQASGDSANRRYRLAVGAGPATAPEGLRVDRVGEEVKVDTGALRFTVRCGAEDLVEGICLSDTDIPLGERLIGELVSRDGWTSTRFVAVAEQVEVEAAGPERATVCCRGYLRAVERGDRQEGRGIQPAEGVRSPGGKTDRFGRFTCRIHAYRGRSYLRVFFRVFNDTDAPAQLVEEFLIRLSTPLLAGEALLGEVRLSTAPESTVRLLVRQHRCDAYEVFDGTDARLASGRHWQGPVTLQTPACGVSAQVRRFASLYPKRMWAGEGGEVVLDLFSRTVEYEQYVMVRGEAKGHEMLFYFHPGTAGQPRVQTAFRAFEAPPILLSPEWYSEHQAFGRGAPLTPEAFPGLYRWMVEEDAPEMACTVPFGLRNWPDLYSDSIFSAYRGTWRNMYQEMDYGAYILALLAGQRAWFDFAEAYQRHFMDADVYHSLADPRYTGACYGIAPYHTGRHPSDLNVPLAGLFLLYYLTGDPDARETALGIAEQVRVSGMGLGPDLGGRPADGTRLDLPTPRAVGWPLRSLAIAYLNTYDRKFLEAAELLAEYALSALMPRRGYFSRNAGTWQYRGGCTGFNSILAAGLIHYWRATGDERVGRACVHIACNLAYDWMSPTEPGAILTTDPLGDVSLAGYALQDAAPLFWGYELTGDVRFLEKGGQVMDESAVPEKYEGRAFGLLRYWEMQDILYYYGLYKKLRKP